MTLKNLIPAMASPMNQDGSIDTGKVAALAQKLIAGGANGLFVAGSMGEGPSLTMEEKAALTRAAVDAAKGRVPVLTGTGEINTRDVIRANELALDAGAAAVSVVTPWYWKLNQEAIYAHYAEVIQKSRLPVLLYNIPGNTGLNAEPETVGRLRKNFGLYGAKDSSGNFENTKGYIDMTDSDFVLLVGSDRLICRGLEAGAKGYISALSNVFTKICASIGENFSRGDVEAARAAQKAWDEVCALVMSVGLFPTGVKFCANRLTAPIGPARLPLPPVDEAKYAAVLPRLMEIAAEYGISL